MALPSNLTPLDIAHAGLVFCETSAKLSIDTYALDLDFQGVVFVRNAAETTTSGDLQNNELDKAYAGLPFVIETYDAAIDLSTMNFADAGLPYVTNAAGSDRSLYAGTQTVTISIPSAGLNGLLRKFPLVRNEFVSSENESAHVFPYVTIQDPALLP
jgi:hypothetical protein